MTKFSIAMTGTHVKVIDTPYHIHEIAFSGEFPGGTAGTVTLTGRKPGSGVYETIPDGVVTLASIHSIQFMGGLEELKLEFSGSDGSNTLYVTINSYA